jgi:Poly(R)-hydroxyalkanoic acid synthase subunit (PHA_synth_III_E)
MVWEMWKKGFDAWENATAKYLEVVLSSPLVLEPAGKILSATMKVKVAQDDAWSRLWKSAGLPTRRDQERLHHAVNQLSSKLLDLEEMLAERKSQASKAASPRHGVRVAHSGNPEK